MSARNSTRSFVQELYLLLAVMLAVGLMSPLAPAVVVQAADRWNTVRGTILHE